MPGNRKCAAAGPQPAAVEVDWRQIAAKTIRSLGLGEIPGVTVRVLAAWATNSPRRPRNSLVKPLHVFGSLAAMEAQVASRQG